MVQMISPGYEHHNVFIIPTIQNFLRHVFDFTIRIFQHQIYE